MGASKGTGRASGATGYLEEGVRGGSPRETHLIGPLGGVGAPDRARVLGRSHDARERGRVRGRGSGASAQTPRFSAARYDGRRERWRERTAAFSRGIVARSI